MVAMLIAAGCGVHANVTRSRSPAPPVARVGPATLTVVDRSARGAVLRRTRDQAIARRWLGLTGVTPPATSTPATGPKSSAIARARNALPRVLGFMDFTWPSNAPRPDDLDGRVRARTVVLRFPVSVPKCGTDQIAAVTTWRWKPGRGTHSSMRLAWSRGFTGRCWAGRIRVERSWAIFDPRSHGGGVADWGNDRTATADVLDPNLRSNTGFGVGTRRQVEVELGLGGDGRLRYDGVAYIISDP